MTTHFTSLPAKASGKIRTLILAAFAVLGANAHGVCVHQRSYVNSIPNEACSATPFQPLMYLAAVGPLPLRFAPPPPVATERPRKAEPVVETVPAPTAPATVAAVSSPAEVSPDVSVTSKEDPAAASKGPKPVRILPDDTPRDVRPEDVLPYFQLSKEPDSSGVSIPFTPASPALPPSSATYQLK